MKMRKRERSSAGDLLLVIKSKGHLRLIECEDEAAASYYTFSYTA